MHRRVVLALLLALAGRAGAQAPAGRWEVFIGGPARTGQSGEIRFEAGGARILLESSDSAFLPLTGLRIEPERIVFGVAGTSFRFEGTVTPVLMQGNVMVGGVPALQWRAWPIAAVGERWPVRPRLVISQLQLGRDGTSVTIPGAWVAAMPAPATLGEEYRRRMVSAGLPRPADTATVAPDRLALGFDPAFRAAGRALLEQIAASPAADTRFRLLFGRPGHLRFDLHDRAVEAARSQVYSGFRLDDAARAIAALGGTLAPGADSLAILAAGWGIWNQLERDTAMVRSAIRGLRVQDIRAATALTALLSGYDIARTWWEDAVRWFLASPWLGTAAAPRTPAALVAAFWEQQTLPLPVLETVRFGGFEAYAVGSVGPLAGQLIRPGNAVASEWLALKGSRAALAPWRGIRGQTDSLALHSGPREIRLTTPAGWAGIHGGLLLPDQDILRIDPGIAPLFATATVVHEWQHLLFTARRYQLGARVDAMGLHVMDDDPWLSEGAAEWATDEILAGAGPGAALLRLLDAAKRVALEQGGGDDPHPTGYRLVRAVSARGVSSRLLRERLVTLMHDPAAFAAASGLGSNLGASPRRLERPIDAAVIPEISFTWDSGLADDIRRRLLVPPLPPES